MRFVVLFLLLATSVAAAPVLYSEPYHQSPTHAESDGLLLIAGTGLSNTTQIIYKATSGFSTPTAPVAALARSTASEGRLQVVAAYPPYSLTVKIPRGFSDTYTLWAYDGAWSNPILINDPRALWSLPRSMDVAAQDRRLYVFGRNLDGIRLRVSGEEIHTLTSIGSAADEAAQIFILPDLPQGSYTLSVSRDGNSWRNVEYGDLTITANPAATFSITSYGAIADDGLSDAAAISNATYAAYQAGGGTVIIPAGSWILDSADMVKGNITERGAIILFPGVSVQGAGKERTTLRLSTWTGAFQLMGNNTVSGIHFEKINESDTVALIGEFPYWLNPGFPQEVQHIRIINNSMHNLTIAQSRTWPMSDIVIAHNNGTGSIYLDKLTDGLLASNSISPPDWHVPMGIMGTGHTRVAITDSLLDGRIGGGWRAGIWSTQADNTEMYAVYNNTIHCPGDYQGDADHLPGSGLDGEAIMVEGAGNNMSFGYADVTDASANTITVAASIARNLTGEWIYIVNGTGLGQFRKIVSHNDNVFVITPSWDVIPDTTSKAAQSRIAWQVYYLANTVDTRSCPLPNPENNSGYVSFYCVATDSMMLGNRLYATEGISVPATYYAPNNYFLNYHIDIRNNVLSENYRTVGGIDISSNIVTPGDRPPLLKFGIRVANNTLTHVNTDWNASIAHTKRLVWRVPDAETMVIGLLFYGNTIRDAQTGIRIGHNPNGLLTDTLASYVVTHNNQFSSVTYPIISYSPSHRTAGPSRRMQNLVCRPHLCP